MEQTQTQTETPTRSLAFPMSGTLGTVVSKSSKTGTPYLMAPFTYTTAAGKTLTRTAMAFGKARDAVLDKFVSGAEIRLYGRYDGGTFAVIGLGLPPKGNVPANDQGMPPEAHAAAPEVERTIDAAAAVESSRRRRRAA